MEVYDMLLGEKKILHEPSARRYVREGTVFDVSDPAHIEEYYLFLFTDLIVWTQKKVPVCLTGRPSESTTKLSGWTTCLA